MDAREIVDAYLQGRIESWGLFRKLVRLGLSTATALAVAGALPAAVKANNAAVLSEVTHDAQESPLLDLLMSQLASQLEKAMGDGSVRPLAATLARIGGNNANLINCGGGNENVGDANVQCNSLKLNFNDGISTNLNGELVADSRQGNLTLNLNGNIGQSNLNVFGILSPRDSAASGRNLNIGKVNMNVSGNVGDVPLNFNGNLGNLNTTNIPK
jgi:hypothetical protein